MTNRTPPERVVADAVQVWWVEGLDSEEMGEWLATKDADETAETLGEVAVAALRRAGWLGGEA